MKHPVGVQVVDPIQYLVQKGLDHILWNLLRLLVSLGSTMVLDDVLRVRSGKKQWNAIYLHHVHYPTEDCSELSIKC